VLTPLRQRFPNHPISTIFTPPLAPGDEAATKLIYLALRNITKQWKNPPVTWRAAATQFAIQFGERFNK
jgi:putative transposase